MRISPPSSIQTSSELDWTALIINLELDLRTAHHGKQAGSFVLGAASDSPWSAPHQSNIEERRASQEDAALGTQPTSLRVLLLGDSERRGTGQGEEWRAVGLTHLCARTSGTTWAIVARKLWAREGRTWPPGFSTQGLSEQLPNNCLLFLNCLPYSWLWNRLVWLCWHDSNYSHFH